MKNKILLSSVSSILLLTAGCTEPGRTTAYSSAAGGVLGAGLGAIVGSQVGSAGAGGDRRGCWSWCWAAIGNALEAHDKKLAANDERLNRQEETIRAQRNQLNGLRNVETDSYSRPTNSTYRGTANSFAYNQGGSGEARYASSSEIQEAKNRLQRGVSPSSSRAQLNTQSIDSVRPSSYTPLSSSYSPPAPSAPIAPAYTETKYAPSAFEHPASDTSSDSFNKSSDTVRERDLIAAPTTEISAAGSRDVGISERSDASASSNKIEPSSAPSNTAALNHAPAAPLNVLPVMRKCRRQLRQQTLRTNCFIFAERFAFARAALSITLI